MPSVDRREYAQGTYLEVQLPWGTYVSARALCSDGVVRKVIRIAETADTFFSVPAAVKVKNKKVAGYVTVNDGVVQFHQYLYRKNGNVLPAWSSND